MKYNPTLTTANPFKRKAEIVLRTMLLGPNQEWQGLELSKELKMSESWVNRILATLVHKKFAERTERTGKNSRFKLTDKEKLLKNWAMEYYFDHNTLHAYFVLGDALKKLKTIVAKEGFQYAITGKYAKDLIKKGSSHEVPHVYVWPSSTSGTEFKDILKTLEDDYDFISANNKENLVIVKSVSKDNVFIGVREIKGWQVVSDLQLFLDVKER